MDFERLQMLAGHADPSVAMSGRSAARSRCWSASWLIANVRTLQTGNDGKVIARSTSSAKARPLRWTLDQFRRASPVTRFPGCEVLPVTTEDMRAIFAAADDPPCRDRHRLSDRRHTRHALHRSDAVEALRGFWVDRYR
jgi:hypothetical protein